MTFPKIDEDFMDTQLSTFGEMDVTHEFLDPRITAHDIEKIVREDTLAIVLETVEGALGIINESFPRIAEMIKSGWGSKELHKKLAMMLQVDTEKRAGFDTPIGFALMKVYQSHMDEFKFEPIGITQQFKQDRW